MKTISKIPLLLAFLLIITLSVLYLNFRTGNLVIKFEDYKINETLQGVITVNIEEGDSVNKNEPILITLTKNKTILSSETITFEEFVMKSNNPEKPSNGTYSKPESYSVEVDKIINHKFSEEGEYDLTFTMFNPEIIIRRAIKVL